MKTILLSVMLSLSPLAGQAATINVAADTSVSSSNATVNYGSVAVLSVGDGASALIAFDLSSLPAGLTASNIEKATLTVFVHKPNMAGSLDLAQVTAPWSEALVTYNNRPTAAAAIQSVPVSASESYVTFDITLLVRQWVIGSAENYGVEISASAGQAGTGTMVDLDSKESTTTSHSAFIDITLVSMGPQGAPGTPGKTGDTGAIGPQGPPGPNVLQAGSAAAPSLSFVGDSKTGLFSAATNTVNIATAGANRLTVRPDGDLDMTGRLRQNGIVLLQAAGGNSGFGINALPGSTGSANTAVGNSALGANGTGYQNTALGASTLPANRGGINNTAAGVASLQRTVTGDGNTGFGVSTLGSLNSGGFNTALGLNAGVNLAAGSNNVYIANQGVSAESGVTRIGTPGTQAATYIAGIRNVTPGVKDAAPVVIDSNGQLGTGLGSAIVYLPSKDSIPANSFTVFSQSCPSDHPVLMGGGCGAGDNDRNGSDVTVNYSGPAPFSNQMVWRCQATNSSSAARALLYYLICSR
jgi:hypothetical protein